MCQKYQVIVLSIAHIARFAHIAHIVNRSNICTLLHRFVTNSNHNKVDHDRSCCILVFSPAGSCLSLPACLGLLHCSLRYCPYCLSVISHSNQQSHRFTVNSYRPPARPRPRRRCHLPRPHESSFIVIQITLESFHPLLGRCHSPWMQL